MANGIGRVDVSVRGHAGAIGDVDVRHVPYLALGVQHGCPGVEADFVVVVGQHLAKSPHADPPVPRQGQSFLVRRARADLLGIGQSPAPAGTAMGSRSRAGSSACRRPRCGSAGCRTRITSCLCWTQSCSGKKSSAFQTSKKQPEQIYPGHFLTNNRFGFPISQTAQALSPFLYG